MTYDDLWRLLEEAGWFTAYSSEGKAWFSEVLTRYWHQDPCLVVYSLGRPAYDTEWLAERREAPRLVVESYARASDGQFRPENVAYEYVKKGQGRNVETFCQLSFAHAGERVVSEFVWLGGSAEAAMTALCNEALAKAASPYRFYEVPSPDQCCYVAFVTPFAYDAVKARGLLTVRELPGNRWGALIE